MKRVSISEQFKALSLLLCALTSVAGAADVTPVQTTCIDGSSGYSYGEHSCNLVKIPYQGTNTITLSESLKEIAVVQERSYSANGSLTIKAPTSSRLKISGGLAVDRVGASYDRGPDDYFLLDVYDGPTSVTPSSIYCKGRYGNGVNASNNHMLRAGCLAEPDLVTSSTNQITFRFVTTMGSSYNYDNGLNDHIHVTYLEPHVVYIGSATGGSISSDKLNAIQGETVTLTIRPKAGFELTELKVMYGGNNVSLTSVGDNKKTFIMPAAEVTVSSTWKDNRKLVIENVTGGTVSSDKESPVSGDVVTLTATPSEGYALSGIKFGNVDYDKFEYGSYGNVKTFTYTQSNSKTQVNPSWTKSLSTGGLSKDSDGNLYVNMADDWLKFIEIPEDVSSFKVYDDGGKNGNYSSYVNEYLTLTAPPYCKLRVTGSAALMSGTKFLAFDGDPNANELYNTTASDESIDVVSTGRMLTLYLKSSQFDAYKGLDLTVEVVENYGYGVVKMPQTGTNAASVPVGKGLRVLDDGGLYKPYSYDADGTLELIARSGYGLKLQGSMEAYAVLNIYDGNGLLLKKFQGKGDEKRVSFINDGGNMTLQFKSTSTTDRASGLDLQVDLVAFYDVDVVDVEGGSVSTPKVSVASGEKVSLTVTPAEGYALAGINVVDEYGNPVTVKGEYGELSSTSKLSFVMPESRVTVTPSWTKIASGSLFVNMPQSGTRTIEIPETVKSFTVYDDGGSDDNYSYNANGTLVLKAPEGYNFIVSGSLSTYQNYAYLMIYDGDNAGAKGLLEKSSGDNVLFSSVITSGNTMTIFFASGADAPRYVSSGFVFNVSLSSALYKVDVSDAAEGVMSADKMAYSAYETVTLTANPKEGYILSGISVVQSNGGKVYSSPKNKDQWFWDVYTFSMPESNVLVTPTWTNDLSGAYVSMFQNIARTIEIPEYVETFHVYDNGGPKACVEAEKGMVGGCYFLGTQDTIALKAPEGYVMEISGSAQFFAENDSLSIYDALYPNGGTPKAKVQGPGANSVPTVTSTDNVVTLYFGSDPCKLKSCNKYLESGFDLTVNLISNRTVSIASVVGGSMTADDYRATHGQPVYLTATPNAGYELTEIVVKDAYGNKLSVQATGTSYKFTMPSSKVTVTPSWRLVKGEYAAVSISKANGKVWATIDGLYNGFDPINIPSPIPVDGVYFERSFSTNGYSTIMLPFDIDASNIWGAKSVIEFTGLVEKDNGDTAIGMSYVWCSDAVATAENSNCNKYAGKLKAYTPYMIEMESETISFDGGVTIMPTESTEARSYDWVFRGTLQKKVWNKGDSDIGHVWGFAAESQGENFKVGQFYKFGAGAWIRPLRAYMVYSPLPKPTTNAPVPKGYSAAAEPVASVENLPETIDVVVVSRGDNGGEHTTVIGKLDTRTGEIHFNRLGKRTFDLKGRNIGKPKAKGVYLKK
ncbi:hypothetical protein [uncultured Fibrobacter sp.]|uniref:InlB B-repeat-containing protein n=1 Tax=uncultured Fibrobacter sp. TaxID=261512 RepID=UPI0026180FFA|nr:hypothetical protein [uncultured Fibrobacter sp.]